MSTSRSVLVAVYLVALVPHAFPRVLADDIATQGETAKLHFDIPSQPLHAALLQYAQQAQMQLVMASERPSEPQVESVALKGEFTPLDALERLLSASRYHYELSGPRTIVIHVK